MALLTREIERRLAAFRTDLVTAFFLGGGNVGFSALEIPA